MVRSVYCGTHIVQHVTDYTLTTWVVRAAEQCCDFSRGGSKYVTWRALQRSLAHTGVSVVGRGTIGYSRETAQLGALRYYRVLLGTPRYSRSASDTQEVPALSLNVTHEAINCSGFATWGYGT